MSDTGILQAIATVIIKLQRQVDELEEENARLNRAMEQRRSVLGMPIGEAIKNLAELHLVDEKDRNCGFSFLDVEIHDIIDQNARPQWTNNPEDQFDVPAKYLVAVGRYRYLKDAHWNVGDTSMQENV